MSLYILEVQKFDKRGSEHIGYMNKIFTSRKKACEYYKKHNPHMRDISAEAHWHSDWDPITKLLYVVREASSELMEIPEFEDSEPTSV